MAMTVKALLVVAMLFVLKFPKKVVTILGCHPDIFKKNTVIGG